MQIRSHAQKYFLKVQKNGTSEHVPPPRPKRKAAHPYPQKASKNGWLSSIFLCIFVALFFEDIFSDIYWFLFVHVVVPRSTGPVQSSVARVETGYAVRRDPFSIPRNPISGSPLSSWSYNAGPTGCLSNVAKGNFLLPKILYLPFVLRCHWLIVVC